MTSQISAIMHSTQGVACSFAGAKRGRVLMLTGYLWAKGDLLPVRRYSRFALAVALATTCLAGSSWGVGAYSYEGWETSIAEWWQESTSTPVRGPGENGFCKDWADFTVWTDPEPGWETWHDGGRWISLEIEVAGWHAGNELGWYDVGSTRLHPIFGGADTPSPDYKYIEIPQNTTFGFYLKNDSKCFTWYTERGLNTSLGETGARHAWVYSIDEGIWDSGEVGSKHPALAPYEHGFLMGWEDMPSSSWGYYKSNDVPAYPNWGSPYEGDFNDLVVIVRTDHTLGVGREIPELPLPALIGLGIIGCLCFRRAIRAR